MRIRIVATYVLLLLFATAISVVAIRQALLIRLDERIRETLQQEVEEFTLFAERGIDPRTGEQFLEENNLKGVFRTYLRRNVPAEGEEILTFTGTKFEGSRLTQRSAVSPLEEDEALTQHFSTLRTVERAEVETPGGPARYVAVPVKQNGEIVGRLVVANFTAQERAEVNEAVSVVAIVGASVLLFGSIVAFAAAGRVLRPVRNLDDTARSITETDLTRRIEVDGHDELAQLGGTFNTMLDRLESAFESQRDFARDAGHELRTPLTIVRGHLELLDDDPVERQKTVALVTDELDRMSRFVADLSLLANAERPDFLRLDTVELGELGDELTSKARALAPRDWTLEASCNGVVVADRQRLTEAIMNLAENASAQTQEGDRIALGTSINGRWASLWVADEGPGIATERQEEIFDRFKRGSESSRHSGSGLGLAIVRAIAEAHGGRVSLNSRPGAGARFTVRIPVDQLYEGPAA
ncbi:MAG: ATP-binding protein [Thermoleophilaceae bacterium]|nr:HAMP domain-containing histidine kinase [Thermoleophilaceae bacterium]